MSTSSTSDEEMKRLIGEFLKRLKYSMAVKADPRDWNSHTSTFYEDVYEMVRNMYLHPNNRALLSHEDKIILKENFVPAFVRIANCTPGVVNNIEAHDMNIAKTRLSELTFLKNEVFDLYKESCNDNVNETDEVKQALKKLDYCIEMLERKISNWSRPDYEYAEDDLDQLPNLNGVPESHHWWTSKHRELCKEKAN